MNGINQLMLGQMGQSSQGGSEGSSAKFTSRGKSEMQFHSLLSQKSEVKAPKIEPSQANKPSTPDQNTANQAANSSNNTPEPTQQRTAAPKSEPAQSKQSSDDGQSANEQVAAQVKEAVQEAGGEVDAKDVIAKVVENADINLSELNLDELFNDIQAALSELNIDSETISDLTSQLTDAMTNVFADVAGQISQQLAQIDPNKGLNLAEDEEVASDELITLTSEAKGKDKQGSSMVKLEQSAEGALRDAANKEARAANEKASQDDGRMIEDFDKKVVVNANKEQGDTELKEKLNLNKNDLNLSKTQFSTNQQGMGGVSNLSQMNQVQSKLAQAQQMSIQGKPGTAEFKQGLSEKVVFMMKGDMNTASLKLNPPELGPLEIKLNMNNTSKQADLTIMTQHALVKDSVEQALPRLRDMLADSGIQLNNVNVSDQNLKQGQQQAQQEGENDGSGNGTSSFYQEVFGEGEKSDEEIMTQLMLHRHRPDGLVDYYA
jgi:flagellar hook-length control protein FliK